MASGSQIADAAPLAIHEVRFEGGVLQRGFWLYVWEVTPADQAPLYYVGRTGDSFDKRTVAVHVWAAPSSPRSTMGCPSRMRFG
jgi:hypothetical protein